MTKQLICASAIIILVSSLCGCVNDRDKTTEESPAEDISAIVADTATENTADKPESEASEEDRQIENEHHDSIISGVSIEFDYTRMSGQASNQIALWVEDEEGSLIKTLFATDFTAIRRGYRNREDALRAWVLAARPESLSDVELDAISSATPASGKQHFDWDLTDMDGHRVPVGKYSIKLEGTLYWSSNVLYTVWVDVGSSEREELEVYAMRTEPDNTDNETMIQNVRIYEHY